MRRLACTCFFLATTACGARTGLPYGAPIEDAAPEADAPDAVLADVPSKIGCTGETETLIYLVSEQSELLSYEPTDASFRLIGNLTCPAAPGATPFSMAVDRRGLAYVVYDDGELFTVSTKDAACTATSWVVGADPLFTTFGMGFVTDQGGPSERLFVASSNAGVVDSLGNIDVATFTLDVVGSFDHGVVGAELTGTGDGRLFGFYTPGSTTTGADSLLVEIDKTTAHVLSTTTLKGVQQGNAWAFAFWGGDFYLFTAPENPGSKVQRYRPSDGSIEEVAVWPHAIVGAGVSTCAPEE